MRKRDLNKNAFQYDAYRSAFNRISAYGGLAVGSVPDPGGGGCLVRGGCLAEGGGGLCVWPGGGCLVRGCTYPLPVDRQMHVKT